MVGRGVNDAMREYGLEKPRIDANSDWFSIIFKRPDLQKSSFEERKGSSQETTQKTTQKILDLIRVNSAITRQELALGVGISEDGVKFHLANLKKEGLLRRVGPDKGGHWEIVKR